MTRIKCLMKMTDCYLVGIVSQHKDKKKEIKAIMKLRDLTILAIYLMLCFRVAFGTLSNELHFNHLVDQRTSVVKDTFTAAYVHVSDNLFKTLIKPLDHVVKSILHVLDHYNLTCP